jgi:ABC-2 type transport system permease protein
MKFFLQIEYLKIKGNNSFKVFSLIFMVFLPIIVILLPSIFKDGFLGPDTYPLMPRSAESSWYYTSYVASWFSLFILSFIIIFHITNEYSAKTVRQNIIDGYTKIDFLKSKISMVLIMAIMATLYVLIIGFIAGIYFKANQPIVSLSPLPIPGAPTLDFPTDFGGMFEGLLFVLGYFLQVLAYFILAVFISIWLRKGALAVIVYFSMFLVEIIFVSQLNSQGLENVTNYFPLHSFSSLLPNFEISFLIFGLGEVEHLSVLNSIVSIVYILLFVFITKFIFYKRDVV